VASLAKFRELITRYAQAVAEDEAAMKEEAGARKEAARREEAGQAAAGGVGSSGRDGGATVRIAATGVDTAEGRAVDDALVASEEGEEEESRLLLPGTELLSRRESFRCQQRKQADRRRREAGLGVAGGVEAEGGMGLAAGSGDGPIVAGPWWDGDGEDTDMDGSPLQAEAFEPGGLARLFMDLMVEVSG
jgi:hypothetical protein